MLKEGCRSPCLLFPVTRDYPSSSNFSPIVNGSTELKREEVALVIESEEGHTFQYYPGESNNTVWPGDGMF